jgi:hypothetical protein
LRWSSPSTALPILRKVPVMASALPFDPDLEDPILEEHVEHALLPYKSRLPPEDLEGFREMLVLFYTTNPVAVRLLAELRKPPTVDESGQVQRRGDPALEEVANSSSRRRAPGGSR